MEKNPLSLLYKVHQGPSMEGEWTGLAEECQAHISEEGRLISRGALKLQVPESRQTARIR